MNTIYKMTLRALLSVTLFITLNAYSQGSETLSKGSAQVSQGSITIGAGAFEVLSSAAEGSARFTVDVIEVAGDVAEITLVSSAQTSQAAAEITVSLASSAVASLAIAAGTAIEIMTIYAENKANILGYILMQKGQVMLFVSPEGSSLTIHSNSL
jgi:hypothetical protein